MNNGVTDKCWHGCAMNGTLIHLLWHCPETQTFWLKIRDYLCKLFEINFLLDPAVGLLGKQREQPQKNFNIHTLSQIMSLLKENQTDEDVS
uniref:Reverse transcriptase zinc-binding domain-containing protein n=1 Tax=Sparus aurata TaxID=8175 RepID=A0A671WDE4_SPAAU